MDDLDSHLKPDQSEESILPGTHDSSAGPGSQMPVSENFRKPLKFSSDLKIYLQNIIQRSTKLQLAALFFLIAGVVVNLVSFLMHFTHDYLEVSAESKTTIFLWVISVILAFFSAVLFSISDESPFRHITRVGILSKIKYYFSDRSHLPIFHIVLVAFFIRVIPIMNNGLYLDEWYWLDTAKLILNGQVFSPFGFIGDQPSNLPAFPVAFLLTIFKNPTFSVRLTGVIYSLLTIILVYTFLKETLGKKAAVVGAGLIALSPWDIHISNLGWNNVGPNPMLVAATLLLLYYVYVKKATILTFFGLAFVVAISMHLLYVAALITIPTACVLAIYLIRNYSSFKLKQVLIFCIYMIVCLSPLIAKIKQNPEQSIGRHENFLNQNMARSGETQSKFDYYLSQLIMLKEDFQIGENNFHVPGLWGITLSPLITFLTGMGILFCFLQVFRKKENSFWIIILLSLFILIIIPFVVLYRTSSVWRSYAILPIVYMLSVFALYQISKMGIFVISKIPLVSKIPINYLWVFSAFIYVFLSIHWFSSFLSVYQLKNDGYETIICQYANNLIENNVPSGSTILIPDEMCFPLITILHDQEQYKFVMIRNDEPIPEALHNSFLMLLNSKNYDSYFNKLAHQKALQILEDHESEKISVDSTTQPVLYILK